MLEAMRARMAGGVRSSKSLKARVTCHTRKHTPTAGGRRHVLRAALRCGPVCTQAYTLGTGASRPSHLPTAVAAAHVPPCAFCSNSGRATSPNLGPKPSL